MPSLRKRVSSYFRQLSFHNEPREKKHNINENSFITKYLQGHITLQEGPPIIYGKNPTDLPNYSLAHYDTGPNTVIGCYSGPKGGLTTVKRTEKHLSVLDADIDYIDTHEDEIDGGNIDKPFNASFDVDDSMLPEDWNRKSNLFYGLSDSLYDRNQVTKNTNGDPIADCFGIIARNDSAILAVADGVNWGEKASIAAKSAIHGCLHYLNKTIFNDTEPFENLTIKTDETSTSSNVPDESANLIGNTREVFVCLLRAFNCAHDLILENKGMLTTLTVAVVLPLKQKLERRTTLSNGVERRDSETQYICCVCNVGDTLAYVYSLKHGVRELTKDFKKPTVVENKASSLRRQATSQLQQGVNSSQKVNTKPRPSLSRTLQSVDDKSSNSKRTETGYRFLRSRTTLDIKASTPKQIIRNDDGIPYVTPIQRYELQLLMIEDILKNGISGKDSPCTSAKQLCENLVSYTISITSAKRHTLEDQDLYFNNNNGLLVEVSSHEKKIRRKKGLEKVQNLPGKLDHVTIVAYNVGNYAH